MINNEFLLSVFLILGGAWALGLLFDRLGLPAMLGELVAGVLLGPPLLGLIKPSSALELLSELGIFFVMFYTGLEMDPRELRKHLKPSLVVAGGGFVLPYALGAGVAALFGATLTQSLFVGLGVSITAIAVNSIILQSLRIHKTRAGAIIIGAAIADDIYALIAMSVLLGLARSRTIDPLGLALVVGKVVAFFALALLAGRYLVPPLTRRLGDRSGRSFTFGVLAAVVMGGLAELAGLHAIIGAFVAGQFVREEAMDRRVYATLSDRFYGLSYGFLVPIFFASLSFHLKASWDLRFLLFTTVLVIAAVVGKVGGCGLGYAGFRHEFRESLLVGFGMNGRGAVELVIASVILGLSDRLLAAGAIRDPLLTPGQFSALVIMAFVTTLITPILLRWSAARAGIAAPAEKPRTERVPSENGD